MTPDTGQPFISNLAYNGCRRRAAARFGLATPHHVSLEGDTFLVVSVAYRGKGGEAQTSEGISGILRSGFTGLNSVEGGGNLALC